MSKSKKIAISALSALIAAVIIICWILIAPLDAEAADVKYYSRKSNDTPFFNGIWGSDFNDENSIDRWFDTLEPTGNDSNFSSLGTTVYPDINGKTVTVDVFNRDPGDSIDDPNFGEGMLIFQAIQYKAAHPEEPMEIYLSSYRISVTASVCANRDSRYFGYMRSIFDKEYDEHGFVRICFMLVEAARMGVKVVIVPHLNSYGVKQYSKTDPNGYAIRSALSYKTYFNNAMSTSCYSDYAAGKKVSDYLTLAQPEWDVNQRGADMQHTKSCLVNKYLDKDGTAHDWGVFLTSSNLDENDFLGRNGNTGSQSGVIITNHEAVYRVTKNYLDTISRYLGEDDVTEFRDNVRSRQTKQFDLIKAGRRNEIDPDDQLVYLGSETDTVFEMYFTPVPGGLAVWDTTYNPYCRFLSEMLNADADTPIVFTWNMPYNDCSTFYEYTFEDIICEAFHQNKHPENRIYLHFESFSKAKYNDLVVGRDVGFKAVNTNLNKYLHSKDMILSYVKDGTRRYVSIISSCNFGVGPLWYRSNSILVIKETPENHGVYTTLGAASTYGAIRGTD